MKFFRKFGKTPTKWQSVNSKYSERLEQINKMAKAYGWVALDHQEGICMISFKKAKDRINIYYSKMTVATCLDHPVKGKTQLYRKWVTPKLLDKIFRKPRIHTNKGYIRK